MSATCWKDATSCHACPIKLGTVQNLIAHVGFSFVVLVEHLRYVLLL